MFHHRSGQMKKEVNLTLPPQGDE
jgi:hypothetical protein